MAIPIAWPPTPWSDLLEIGRQSGPERRQSLHVILSTYWRPIARYFEIAAPRDKAEDWAQEFVVHFLEKDLPVRADPSAGRFRCYLSVCLRNFAASRRRKETREHAAHLEDEIAGPASDRAFHCAWAEITVERTLERMAREASGDERRERMLRAMRLRYGLGSEAPASNPDIGAALGASRHQVEDLLRAARLWFREAGRAEVSALVESDEWIEPELWSLAEALGLSEDGT